MIENYISKDLEDGILDHGVYRNPFVSLRGRRVQAYGGTVTEFGLSEATNLPNWVDIFSKRLFDEHIFPLKPNHVLVNEYKPGDGIMPHTDGPAYYPIVSTLSLGSASVLQFWDSSTPDFGVFLPQRSLVIFGGSLYYEKLHSIEMVPNDYILQDSCGNFTTTKNNQISPIKGPLPLTENLPSDLDLFCPVCNQLFNRGSLNIRETRVSLTIRYVPLIG